MSTVSGTLSGSAAGYLGGSQWVTPPGSAAGGTWRIDVFQVTVSGTLGGGGSGSGSISGSTAVVTNVQPTIILNQMIRI